MKTGLLIKTAREKANMSQAQLASKMGVTNHCISSWERGKRNPKYETLSRIADALGVDVNCLLTGSETDADVVAVVRCKECKYGELLAPEYFPDEYYCHDGKGWNKSEFYCAGGKWRGEDGNSSNNFSRSL